MHHFFRIVAFVGLTCLAVITPAAADTISITSGFIVAPPFEVGHISIAGTRGFSIEGQIDPNDSFVAPRDECGTPCPPGTTVGVGAVLFGVTGTATLDGNDELTGDTNDPVGLALELVGMAIMLPQLVGSPTVVTAPFSVAQNSVFNPGIVGGTVSLNGSGIASVSLSPAFPGGPNEPA